MCGILGIIDHKGQAAYDLEKLGAVQQHRGPDSKGYYTDSRAILVHNRLSILDLSENAAQPFFSIDGKYIVVYNGEVYNFQEIANEVKAAKGNPHYTFRSSSDTEIILEAFLLWGTGFLEKLNGMFAIAIYEKETGKLFLFRDRLGIKPLFYSLSGGSFYFSSELKGILAALDEKPALNYEAIQLFLRFGYIAPPLTIYNEVFKLMPGEFLEYHCGHIRKERYWDPRNHFSKHVIDNEHEALEKITGLLKSSVRYQLISDVPVGIFLSGGIDSSLITALACDSGSVKPNTFTIGFEENKYDESGHARKIAQHFGTNHNELILSYKNAIDYIDIFLDAYDEPYADSSGIPTLIVSKLAREKVKVALSGEGGDELFLGYGTYNWAKRLSNPFLYFSRGFISTILGRMSSERYQRAARYFNYNRDEFLPFHIFSTEQNMFSRKEAGTITKRQPNTALVLKNLSLDHVARKLNAVEQQSLFDTTYYLPGDLLTKMDRASMRFSLEARVPFLDHRLVEMSLNIHSSLKLKNKDRKHLLKKILFRHVPASYFDRPKQGFSIPLENWMLSELRGKILDQLHYLDKGVVDIATKEINTLTGEFYNGGKSYLYNRVWLLFVLSRWLEKNRGNFRS